MIKQITLIVLALSLSISTFCQSGFGAQNDLSQHNAGDQIFMERIGGSYARDIVSINNGLVTWWETLGNLEFGEPQVIVDNPELLYAIPSDVNDDGWTDIVGVSVLPFSDRQLTWYENLGDGSFSESQNIGSYDGQFGLRSVDIDRDGADDLVLIKGGVIEWIKSLEDGTYESPIEIGTYSCCNNNQFEFYDIDGDNYLDLILTSNISLRWYKNLGNGQFSDAETIHSFNLISAFTIGSFEGVGSNIVVAYDWSNIGVIPILGNGNFGDLETTNISTSEVPNQLAIADMDSDYWYDLVILTEDDVTWHQYTFGNFSSARTIYFESINAEYIEAETFLINQFTSDGVNSYPEVVLSTGDDGRLRVYHNDEGDFSTNDYVSLAEGLAPTDVFALDMDSNGSQDIATLSESGRVAWFQNQDSEFGVRQDISVPSLGYSRSAFADLDGDGDEEIVGVTNWTSRLEIRESLGNGAFEEEAIEFNNVYRYGFLELIDLDTDGDLDVLLTDQSQVNWFQNQGALSFDSEEAILVLPSDIRDMEYVDMDNDNDLDIVVSLSNNDVSWYENDGTGTFNNEFPIQSDINIKALNISDLNEDGDLDIIGINSLEIVWIQNMSGSFSEPMELVSSSSSVKSVKTEDVDNDGFIDIVVGTSDHISWYRNLGNMSYTEELIISTRIEDVNYIELTDLDNDTDLDLIAGSTDDKRLSWFEYEGIPGCMDPSACNYLDYATDDDGSCCFGLCGCNNPSAANYDINANCDDGSCAFQITGTVYYDENENGELEASDLEYTLPLQEVTIEPLGWTTWTDDDGQFSFTVDQGDYSVSINNNLDFPTNTTDATLDVEITSGNQEIEFGVTDEVPNFDVFVDFYPFWAGYPCDDLVNHNICFRNGGNVPIDGVVEVEFSELFQDYIEVTPIASVEGNIIYMNFENLLPGEMFFYDVRFLTPTVDFIGEFLTSTARVYGTYNGEEVAYGEEEITIEMTCAYDPNDKQVFPAGYAEPHFILNDTELEYLVRFQNTGNAPATNVLITDTLDENLNLETFALMANSHSVQTTLKPETRVVEFFFENIMLPDSTNNEPESHGLVSFVITPYTALDPGTELNNTANIYFDNNPPIITNTTWNTIYECTDELASVENVPESVCAGEEFSLENTQPYIETYTWSSGITDLATESILETSLEEGLQVVLLEVENPLCVATNTMTIDVLDSPEIVTSEDALICDESEEVLLTATSEFPVTWEGLGMNNQYSVSPTETTTYHVQSSNDIGCTREESVTVTVSERPEIAISEDAEICRGDEIQISASSEVPFEWIDLGTAADHTVSTSETEEYIAVATNEEGCETEESVIITVNPVPQAQAGEDIEICIGESVDLTASGGDTYQWTNFDQGETITVSPETQTTYEVSVQNEYGCTDTDELLVEVNPLPAIEITENTSICLGETTIISASSDAEIEWLGLGSGDAFSVAPSQSQEYTSVATNEDGCETQATVLITVNPLPMANAGEDLEICSGETIELTATGGDVYQWTGFNVGPTIVTIPNQDTVYEVTVTNEFNCSDTDEVTVQVNEYPDTPEITITGNDLLSDAADSYQWYLNGEAIDGATDQEYIIEEDGDYAVEVTNEFGCSTLSDEQSLVFVGLEELSRWNDLKIYPNPASNIVVIETGMDQGIIEIFDASGRMVLSQVLNQSKMQLDVSGFSVGVYQVLLRSAKGHSTTRVSISK